MLWCIQCVSGIISQWQAGTCCQICFWEVRLCRFSCKIAKSLISMLSFHKAAIRWQSVQSQHSEVHNGGMVIFSFHFIVEVFEGKAPGLITARETFPNECNHNSEKHMFRTCWLINQRWFSDDFQQYQDCVTCLIQQWRSDVGWSLVFLRSDLRKEINLNVL